MKPKLKFEFTDHAKIQMVFRKVSEGQVTYCVLHPDTVEQDRYDPAVSVAVRETSPDTFLKVHEPKYPRPMTTKLRIGRG